MKATAVNADTKTALTTAANEARGLAMDSIAAAHSGHMGLPLGAAEVGASLYGLQMSYNPKDPTWINRDRFILSAGHGSMFLYSWLNLAGFDLPTEEVKNFRQHHSMTPGHPEFPSSQHNTPGIECTTGPLGQGVLSEMVASKRVFHPNPLPSPPTKNLTILLSCMTPMKSLIRRCLEEI